MNKKIILSGILAAVMLGTTAFAEISISEGELDRAFDENKTLYYVEISSDKIPDITAQGYETIKKAEEPYSGGALTEKNTTILKNTQTGIRYRFVFERKGTMVEVSDLSLSSDGVLTLKGTVEGMKNIKLLILKPKEAFSEENFTASDIDETKMEETVLDAVEITSADIIGDVLTEYKFPVSAVSGQYGFLITGDGITQNYYNTLFYMSKKDIDKIIADVNEKSAFDSENTVKGLRKYVEDNVKALYLDITNYEKLSDMAKDTAISKMESQGGYETLDEIADAFYKGVTIAWLYDGLSVETIMKDNEYLTLAMLDNYLELKNKSSVDKAVKGTADEEELKKKFNNAVSVAMINEADPAEIKDIIENYNIYLGIKDTLYNYFMANSAKCVKALGNKSFANTAEIEAAIEAVKNGGSGTSNNKGTGISSSLPSTDTGYVAPITEQKPEVSTTPSETPVSASLPFKDIDNVSWAHTAIEHLYNNKILNGKSESIFAPNDYVKREEFVKLIVNGFGLDKEGKTNFEDVDNEAWYAEFLNIAYNTGVITGISDTEFGVGRYVTREDIAVMIYRAVGASDMDFDIIVENPAELTDLEDVSSYAKEAVEFMISKGAVNGIDGEFKPKAYATRAQTAQMLYQIIKIR